MEGAAVGSGGGRVFLRAEEDGEPAPREPTPAETNRTLLIAALVGAVASALCAVAWVFQPHAALLESPFVWAALIAFWIAAFDVIYLAEIREIERAVERHPGLSVEAVRILWLPNPGVGRGQASLVVKVRSTTPDFPPEFSLFFNLNFTWAMNLVGVRISWTCKETGVLLLMAERPRFLSGASVDSLDLPSPEMASIRGLIHPGAEWEGVPSWGRAPSEEAQSVIGALRPEAWLLGSEQPYVAFEAVDGRIEKWWPPLVDRLVALDADAALDIAKIVRAFDLDIVSGRRGE